MGSPSIRSSFTREELAGLGASAAVIAVMLGPDAVWIRGVDSPVVPVVSAALLGALAFTVGALALLAMKRR
jgi:hypothetical protein